ncbi:hypothetical protein DSO57_1025881 [Entomophthora muscae]|uniref:Uncharacterized protein n=1 Tax=Entomophthora muscae TaxID=34485 RepID=A0ACC2SRJ2_9FUNG|nr:hypothetical protein DSO57_1025881 [Entomophthora muscae]
MPRNYYLIAGIVYFCSNLIILFAFICESTTQYKLAYPYPLSYTSVALAKPPHTLDLEYFHPHHLDLPPAIKEIPTVPPLLDAPPTQDFSKLGFVYITLLGLDNQVVPQTGSWRPLATALNYLVCIAPIVYMAFQARPASPVRVQPDSGMGRDTRVDGCSLEVQSQPSFGKQLALHRSGSSGAHILLGSMLFSGNLLGFADRL